MLMSRRIPPTWVERVRVAVWPRRSWSRSARYAVLRLRRIKSLPRSLALGAATGIFVAILPIPGLQVVTAAGLAWLIRGHRGMAALATFAANPLTYLPIWIASYLLGAVILGTPLSHAANDLAGIRGLMTHAHAEAGAAPQTLLASVRLILPAFATLVVGSLPLAAISALAAYVGMRRLLRPAGRGLDGSAVDTETSVVQPKTTFESLTKGVSDAAWRRVAGRPLAAYASPIRLPFWDCEADA